MSIDDLEPKVGHNKFLSDHGTGIAVDDSEAEGEAFDTSDFDHMFTADELADIKKRQGRK